MAWMTYREAIRGLHAQEMARDESVVLLGIDVGPLGGLFGNAGPARAVRRGPGS